MMGTLFSVDVKADDLFQEETTEQKIKSVTQMLIDLVKSGSSSEAPVAVFTGAGISVESGVPDFRSEGGVWTKYNPEQYGTYEAFLTHPERTWEMTYYVNEMLQQAKPNAAHLAFAEMEQYGLVSTVITQNIDGLHQQCGTQKLIELHGVKDCAHCIKCSRIYRDKELADRVHLERLPPTCECGGVLKPDVVLFHELIPADKLQQAKDVLKTASILFVIGSSLSVSPANQLPVQAKMNGARVIYINKDVHSLEQRDPQVMNFIDVSIEGNAIDVIPAIWKAVKAKIKPLPRRKQAASSSL